MNQNTNDLFSPPKPDPKIPLNSLPDYLAKFRSQGFRPNSLQLGEGLNSGFYLADWVRISGTFPDRRSLSSPKPLPIDLLTKGPSFYIPQFREVKKRFNHPKFTPSPEQGIAKAASDKGGLRLDSGPKAPEAS